MLLMLTARADEMPAALARLDDLDRELPVLQLSLTPLGRDDTARLTRALAGTGREDASLTSLADAVWTASEGSPFIVIETLRALADGSTAETPGNLPLPQRVRRLIQGRLNRLGPESRQLAATAAVIGRDFDHLLLQKAAGFGDDEALAGLEELVRRRIVHTMGAGLRVPAIRATRGGPRGVGYSNRSLLRVADAALARPGGSGADRARLSPRRPRVHPDLRDRPGTE